MSNVVVGLEPFASLRDEAIALGEQHFLEVNCGLEPRRKFRLDCLRMELAERVGALKIVSARREGELVGYFTWTVMSDTESEGLLIAEQGAWYVAPEAGFRLADRMWRRSLIELRLLGVKMIWPHHHLQGRGAGLGRFFERQGAKPYKVIYGLWIGEPVPLELETVETADVEYV